MSALTPRHGLAYPSPNEKVNNLGNVAQQLAESLDKKLTIRTGSNGTFKRATNLVMWEEASPSLVGRLWLKTKIPWGNHMFRIDFKGWEYFGEDNVIDLSCTGYTFAADGNVHNHHVSDRSSRPLATVEYFRENSTGNLAIALNAFTTWEYPKMTVDAWLGHYELADNLFDGWSIVRSTDLSPYTLKRSINMQRSAATGDSGWVAPAFVNGWYAYVAPYALRVRRKNGVVYLQGLAQPGSGSHIFTLPPGWRPNNRIIHMAGNDQNGVSRVDVDALGQVSHMSGAFGYLAFNMSFPVDQ